MRLFCLILSIFLPVAAHAGDIYHKIECKNSCWIETYEKKLLLDKRMYIAELEKKGGRYVGFAHSESWYADLYFYPQKELLTVVSDNGNRSHWTCRKIKRFKYHCE